VNADELGGLLREEGVEIDGNTAADMFINMVEIYQSANEQIKKAAQKIRADNFSEEQIKELRKTIANSVMQSYATYGTETNNSVVIRNLMWKVDDLKQQLNYSKTANKIINRILDNAQSLRDLKNKKYHNAGDTFFKELKAPEGLLAGIKNRSDISKSTTRKRIIEYGKFYNEQNELLRDYIDKDILEDINLIASNENQNAALTLDEIKALDRILANFKHIANSYDTIFRNGRTERVLDLASKGYEIIEQTPEIDNTLLTKSVLSIINPRDVIKLIDNFNSNGVLTSLTNNIKDGETNMLKYKINLEAPFKEFLKEHKKYIKELDKTKMTIRGVEFSKNQALSILLTSERRQAQPHIQNGGIAVYVNEGKWYNKHEVKKIIHPTLVDFERINNSLTEVDKQYLHIVRKFFNEDARQLKIDTDMKLKGYTNIEESNDYYPISVDRDVIARNLGDVRSIIREIQGVTSYSFNKELKQNADNRIAVGDITTTISRHLNNMATYAGLAEPIKNFDLVYNRNLAQRDANGNIVKGTERSIREIASAKWSDSTSYITKYINDIAGLNFKPQTLIDKFLNWLRGCYAKFQLGFNVKVWFNQLTSIPAAMTILSGNNIIKGLTVKINFTNMDKYCEYARARNYENAVVKSEALLDKVGKIGEISTKPIAIFDRAAIGKLWNACQYQIEQEQEFSFGTEENMIEAGKLLERVIRETQPNFNASERSSLLRSDHELVKTATMFMSQPMQNLSLLMEGVLEYKMLKKMQKNGVNDLGERLQNAKTKIKKSIAAFGTETILFVLVSQAFKHLFKKNDEEEPVLDIAKDFGSALTGMFPLVRDVYNKLVYKYDADIFVTDSFNTLGDAVNAMNSLLTKMASGEDVTSNQVLSVFKKMCMGLGMFTGIPTRNILNQLLGIIRNINPELAEEIQHSYNANYGKIKTTSSTSSNDSLTKTLNSVIKKTTQKNTNNNLSKTLNNLLRSK
ncbi:MAG: hypothetical protein NC548_60785, partial [Lachnospiraceae bacterium]|nr:hypothetical protein [Lachnospiraceae bacterium]